LGLEAVVTALGEFPQCLVIGDAATDEQIVAGQCKRRSLRRSMMCAMTSVPRNNRVIGKASASMENGSVEGVATAPKTKVPKITSHNDYQDEGAEYAGDDEPTCPWVHGAKDRAARRRPRKSSA